MLHPGDYISVITFRRKLAFKNVTMWSHFCFNKQLWTNEMCACSRGLFRLFRCTQCACLGASASFSVQEDKPSPAGWCVLDQDAEFLTALSGCAALTSLCCRLSEDSGVLWSSAKCHTSIRLDFAIIWFSLYEELDCLWLPKVKICLSQREVIIKRRKIPVR